ncbi:protein ACCELERATED CELL DEATH 6-like [Triticum aestivum]|nr:protein ACCELERATED CELL DEATH 6-like [Triticum aestivum]
MNAQDNDGNTALHLAVDVGDLSGFFTLLRNPKVLLDIRNNKDQTPLDLAWSKRNRTVFSYGRNPDRVIYWTLRRAGASHASSWKDRLQELCNSAPMESQEDKEIKEEKEKEESANMTDSTRTLGIGSVLIASVTFTATFTVPAGIKASDHTTNGTPGILGTWYFNAFMMANTLAFICSSIATVGLMFAGMPLVKLPIRRRHFLISVFFASTSLTCLNVAFALGVYMVLAPVGLKTAIAICVITPLVLLYRNADNVHKMVITSWLIYVRRGFIFACCSLYALVING